MPDTIREGDRVRVAAVPNTYNYCSRWLGLTGEVQRVTTFSRRASLLLDPDQRFPAHGGINNDWRIVMWDLDNLELIEAAPRPSEWVESDTRIMREWNDDGSVTFTIEIDDVLAW